MSQTIQIVENTFYLSHRQNVPSEALIPMFSACGAAVKSRPVLHHCVAIFFWSSGIMECTSMLFTFENGVRSCAMGRQWCDIIHYH